MTKLRRYLSLLLLVSSLAISVRPAALAQAPTTLDSRQPQGRAIFPYLTVEENLRIGPVAVIAREAPSLR